MTPISLAVHVSAGLCLFTLAGTPARAQTPAERPGAEAVRARVERALAQKDQPRALQAYEQLREQYKVAAPDLLQAIATARAEALRRDDDPRIKVEACAALLLPGRHADCVSQMTTIANDAGVDLPSRLAAAGTLRKANLAGEQLFDFVLGQALTRSPTAAADALAQLDPAASRDPLKRLAADSDNADARYMATMALARMRGDDLVPVLRTVASEKSAGAARLAAYIGLAANGDAEGLRVLNETLPLIKGRERVEAALALISLNDPRGPSLLAEVSQGDHDLLRIDAAEAMFPMRREAAGRVILDGLASGNPWIRARAIRAVEAVKMPQTASLRRAMLDSNSWVAASATRAVLRDALTRPE
jgi:HEAT repeat protein